MKLLLTILACLVAASAGAQTIKSLGVNTTNGQIVLTNANTVFPINNSLSFVQPEDTAAVLTFTDGSDVVLREINWNNPGVRSALGLGIGDNVEFREVRFGYGILQDFGLRAIAGQISGYSTITNNAYTNLIIDLGSGSVGEAITAHRQIAFNNTTNAATTRTNLGLGATNAVTFSNITASGTLAVTGNVTMSGVNNTATAQTADSGASLMTRDLVGQELANPRNKMQTTYWFSMEGLGLWQLANSGASIAANRGAKFGPSLAFYTGTRSSANAAGLGLRLGATPITGAAMWTPVDGGAFTARTHVVNYFSATGTGNRAFGFSFAAGANTNFWGQPNSFGLFWVQQPTNTWAGSTAFTANDRIAVSNVVWAVSTAGTTDTNEPVWTDLINSTVTNGTAVFRNLGPHTSNNWVLAIGSTNASEVVMTNTGKSTWLRAAGGNGHDVLLTLRYGTNTTAPYTVYGSVADGTGQGAEVTLNLPTNNVQVSPQYWLRYDSTNSSGANDVAGIRYFSIDAELPPLN